MRMYKEYTIGDTATRFFEQDRAGSNKVMLTLDDAQIRFRLDGSDPSATSGHTLNPGDQLVLEGMDLINFRAIRTGATNARLCVTFMGY